MAVSYENKHTLICDPAILLRGIYPNELKKQTIDLFVVATTWRQVGFPSLGE